MNSKSRCVWTSTSRGPPTQVLRPVCRGVLLSVFLCSPELGGVFGKLLRELEKVPSLGSWTKFHEGSHCPDQKAQTSTCALRPLPAPRKHHFPPESSTSFPRRRRWPCLGGTFSKAAHTTRLLCPAAPRSRPAPRIHPRCVPREAVSLPCGSPSHSGRCWRHLSGFQWVPDVRVFAGCPPGSGSAESPPSRCCQTVRPKLWLKAPKPACPSGVPRAPAAAARGTSGVFQDLFLVGI